MAAEKDEIRGRNEEERRGLSEGKRGKESGKRGGNLICKAHLTFSWARKLRRPEAAVGPSLRADLQFRRHPPISEGGLYA